MNLKLYFRLITVSIFQPLVTRGTKNRIGRDMNYDNCQFYCPRVIAKDGFEVSLQINNCNYCESENGYRELGFTWKEVEFGYSNMDEPLMHPYCEMWDDVYDEESDSYVQATTPMRSVGIIPLSVMEEVFEKHGGIDWEATLSVDKLTKFMK